MKTKFSNCIMRNRVFLWIALITFAVLVIPFIAMQFTNEVHWNVADFIIMGVLVFGAGTVFVLAARKIPQKYWFALGVIIVVLLLYIWGELAVGIFTNLGSESIRLF